MTLMMLAAAAHAQPVIEAQPLDMAPGIEYRSLPDRRSGVVRREGYDEVKAPAGYADVIDQLIRRVPATHVASPCAIRNFRPTNVLVESPRRLSIVFADASGRRALLTWWRFIEDGARIVVNKNVQNASVNGTTAVIALARDGAKSLWTVNWIAAGQQYELYVEPKAKEPTEDVVTVKAMATSVSCRQL